MDLFSSDDLTVLKSVFGKYDTDGSGYLNLKEFTLFLVRLGKHVKELKKVSPEIASAVFALIDKNGDEKINFQEFCEWWNIDASKRYGYFTGEKKELLRKSYNLYYKYSSSSERGMTFENFGNLMDTLGMEYDEEHFDSLDIDHDGTLSFEEFCNWLNWF